MTSAEQDAEATPAGRRGRWRSGMATKRRILDAARARFASDGYEHATVRAIAADAEVDPSMVHYFFGRKDQLFAAAMDLPGSPRTPVAELLSDGPAGLGHRLVRRFLEVWDATGQAEPLLVLVRSAGDRSADRLREFIQHEFVGPLVRHLDLPDARLRAGLVTTQLLGLATARYVVRVDPIASADHHTLTTWLGPIVQTLLTASPGSVTEDDGDDAGEG